MSACPSSTSHRVVLGGLGETWGLCLSSPPTTGSEPPEGQRAPGPGCAAGSPPGLPASWPGLGASLLT